MSKSLRSIAVFVGLALSGLSLAQSPAEQSTQPAFETVEAAQHPYFNTGSLPEWSKLTPAQAQIDAKVALRLAQERIEQISNLPIDEACYENTYQAIEDSMQEVQRVALLSQHLSLVSDTPERREAMTMLTELNEAIMSAIYTNEKLWVLLKEAARPEKLEGCTPAQKRAAKQLYDIFVDNGAELPLEKKQRVLALEKEMLQLSLQYDKNLQDFAQNWELLITDLSELDGVYPEILTVMENAALAKGLCTKDKPAWLVTLRDETAHALMCLCEVEETRKKCWHAVCGSGADTPYDTVAIIDALMQKRTELANILGFKNYADYEARTRMVHSGDEAMAFVDYLMQKLKPLCDEEQRQMMRVYSSFIGKDVDVIPPWDALLANALYLGSNPASTYGSISAYLKYTDVLNGLFHVYGKLLGLEFKQLPGAYVAEGETCPEGKVEIWHPSVKCVAVLDAETKQRLGVVYFDLFRRENKRAGAWCAPVRLAVPGPQGAIQEPHVVSLQANFTPPVKGRPTVLSHQDVIVLFHEFGHVLHNVLSHTEIQGHSAMGVAWDFTEFPSTLSENWAWSPEVLGSFARHYKTRKPCPANLLQNIAKSRHYMAASTYMETLQKAKLDLEIHMHYEEKFKGRCIDDVSADLLKEYALPYSSTQYSQLRNLSHCFAGGYAAGVYTYLWSEVMAADAFTKFAEKGLMNPEIGKTYRETILEKGDSIPADELYRMFMGREPKVDAFLKSLQP